MKRCALLLLLFSAGSHGQVYQAVPLTFSLDIQPNAEVWHTIAAARITEPIEFGDVLLFTASTQVARYSSEPYSYRLGLSISRIRPQNTYDQRGFYYVGPENPAPDGTVDMALGTQRTTQVRSIIYQAETNFPDGLYVFAAGIAVDPEHNADDLSIEGGYVQAYKLTAAQAAAIDIPSAPEPTPEPPPIVIEQNDGDMQELKNAIKRIRVRLRKLENNH